MVTRVQRVAAVVLSGWRWVASNPRELLFVAGLVLLHLGLRAVEPWAPGGSLVVPGSILTAVAVFGPRGGFVRRRKE